MEAPTMTPAPTPSPSPMYTPPPAPTPAPAPSPVPTPAIDEPPQKMGAGGAIREFLSDINILDVLVAGFVVGGLSYMVYYYKYQMNMGKNLFADLSGRVSKLESMAEAAKRKAEANATGNGRVKKGLVGLR